MDQEKVDVWDIILNTIPTGVAFKTSEVSRQFRNRCLYLEKLVFDDKVLKGNAYLLMGEDKLTTIVFPVLMCHLGKLKEFVCGFANVPNCMELNVIISHLRINHHDETLKKFTLRVTDDGYYWLPPSFFQFKQLSHLELYSCIIEPPSNFSGFTMLTNLRLFAIDINMDDLILFLSKSPLIKDLSLLSCVNEPSSYGFLEFALSIPKVEHLQLGCSPFRLLSNRGTLSTQNNMFSNLKTLSLTSANFIYNRDILAIKFTQTRESVD